MQHFRRLTKKLTQIGRKIFTIKDYFEWGDWNFEEGKEEKRKINVKIRIIGQAH